MAQPLTVDEFVVDYIGKITAARPPDPEMKILLETVMLAGINAGLLLVSQHSKTNFDLPTVLDVLIAQLDASRARTDGKSAALGIAKEAADA